MRRDRRAAVAMAAPALAALALVAAYPLAAVAWLSLRRKLPVFGIDEWAGLSNFAFMLSDARFWNALANTAYFTAVSVAIELVLGLGFALVLDRASFHGGPSSPPYSPLGRGALRAAVLVPWAIPTVVSAKMWAWMLDPESGIVNRLLGGADIDWLGTPALALHAAIVVDVWKTTPFVALLLLAGLQTIPPDLYRAARVDGATGWRAFREVTLPLLRPAIVVTLLFRALDGFRVFDAVYVLTGGGPANTTETLSIYAYKVLFQTAQFGYGSALALATFACVALIAAAFLAMLSRVAREAG